MKFSSILKSLILFALCYVFVVELVWKWGYCRIYVAEGESLLVRYKGNLLWPNPPAAEGDFAKTDEQGRPTEIGFLKEMPGPGRHFRFDPLHYERTIVKDTIIEPGQVGVVSCKLGKNLPEGEYLVDGDVGESMFKGILRKVLKPGRYRINSYGYDVTIAGIPVRPEDRPKDQRLIVKQTGWVEVPTGYVGVVTNLAGNKAIGTRPGIQENVLQPGLYAFNPREQEIDIVEVGFWESTIKTDLVLEKGRLVLDENGEPVIRKGGNQGINFPSNDGFPISLDFTAIWGITPEQAPKVVSLFGNVDAVEKTLIIPEINSICRILGSKAGAVDLLVGKTREAFQTGASEDFRKVLEQKSVSLQVGLVRHIYIPKEVRDPIQKANIAEESKLTLEMEDETNKIEGSFEEAKQNVLKAESLVQAETEKMYREQLALGMKEVEEIRAETEKLVAEIAKKTAELDAQASLLTEGAKAEVDRMKKEAEAQKFELAVKAFGSPEAYNQWSFASKLPADFKMSLFHAGPGTLWTDLKSFQETAFGKVLQNSAEAEQAPAKSNP